MKYKVINTFFKIHDAERVVRDLFLFFKKIFVSLEIK